ncbi:sulfotransferase domain-containing protein [Chloroflexota bacterium]
MFRRTAGRSVLSRGRAGVSRAYREPGRFLLRLRRKILRDRLIVVIGSGHRVGSTWLYRMVKEAGRLDSGKAPSQLPFRAAGSLLREPTTPAELRRLRGYVILKTHSLPPVSNDYDPAVKFVTVFRDPRDVLVSASFFLAHLDTDRGGWGHEFQELSVSERIEALLAWSRLLQELEEWYRTPLALKVKYEELKARPVEQLEDILAWLGLPVKRSVVESAVQKESFATRAGRRPGEESEELPMRKGIIGDWHNHFDSSMITSFKNKHDTRWNRLLVEMGYEETLDW